MELANINCRVEDIIAGVVEGVTSIDNQGIDLVKDIGEEGTTYEKRMGNMDDEELGSIDKEVDKEVDLEETSSEGSVAEEEELEAGVSLHLTDSTAGFLLIFTFVALDFKSIARLSFFNAMHCNGTNHYYYHSAGGLLGLSDTTFLRRSSNLKLAVASISILTFLLASLYRHHLDK